MSTCCCRYKCSCTILALIVSLVIGIIGAFLQITAVITVTPVILWVFFGIAAAILGLLVLSTPLRSGRTCQEGCSILNTLLIGILGTILLSAVLLLVGITATSVVSAILVGLVLFFFALSLTALACYVRCTADCTE